MHTMKTKLTIITAVAAAALGASPLFAQPPASPAPPAAGAPAVPPAPPAPPAPADRHDKMPKVPVTWLGVETSSVPKVVSEQLGLPKGFGLVIDYVVPEGPAAAAGLQPNDILRLMNDQILMDPDQLGKLVRSFADGTTVTFTVLRKGQEQKVPVKLGKKEVSQHHMGMFSPGDFRMGDFDMSEFQERMNDLKEKLNGRKDVMQSAVMRAHEEVDRARERAQQAAEKARERGQREAEKARAHAERDAEKAREQAERDAERAQDDAERAREQAQRAQEQAFRNGGKITITNNDQNGTHSTTHIDLSKAQIVFSDDKGELRIDSNSGKKILTAKDPQGRLLFSGPVENKEDIDKLPQDVRDRFNKLEQKDLPQVTGNGNVTAEPENGADEDSDSDMNSDESDGDSDSSGVEQVKFEVPGPMWKI